MKAFGRGIDIGEPKVDYDLNNKIHREIVAKNWARTILGRTMKRLEAGADTDVYAEARKAGRFNRELPHEITSLPEFKAAVIATGKVYIGAVR